MRPLVLSCCALLAALLIPNASAAPDDSWQPRLKQEVERIDRSAPGSLGVYVKRLADGSSFGYGAEQPWYLGSTVKVPIAIAVLRQVDAGKLRLADRLKLEATDKIEAGQLVWRPDGTVLTVDELLRRMLMESDNTAANMLIRAIGEDELNRTASDLLGGSPGFERLTTLAQVRRDVYAEIHPRARELSNAELVRIASAPMGPERVQAVRRALDLRASDLQAGTIEEAYRRYYDKRLNSATLEAYGAMLERLVRGQLLSPDSMRRLYADMKVDIYTGYRLQAGLPRRAPFIHKTGTQYERACHMGVIDPEDGGARAVVVAACVAGIDEQKAAGPVFEKLGRALAQNVMEGVEQTAAVRR